MNYIIDGIDFHELEPQKYYSPPATWDKKKKQDLVRTRIFSNQWSGARKMDGAFYKFVKYMDGSTELLGRTKGVGGDYLNKIEWVPQLQPLFDELDNGTCLIGEIYFPNKEGSKNVTSIMGCLKDKALSRQEQGDKLHYYIFDILAYDGKSWLDKNAFDRFDELNAFSRAFPHKYVEWAQYYSGEQLWNMLGDILSSGGEGIVITKNDSKYQPGKRPSTQCMKIKKEISDTIDCFFTGRILQPTKDYSGKELETWKYWINSITEERIDVSEKYFDYTRGEPIIPVTKPYYYNWAGSLEIGLVKDDKVVPIGYLSGLTDEIKENYEKYKGAVIEVSAMEIGTNADGSFSGLRHAKMLQFRKDKLYKDCLWSQLEEV